MSYLGLGRVFPANMTGNTVLMGLGLAQGDFAALARSACALGGFVLAAAMVGAIPARRRSRRAFRLAVLCELLLLVALAVWWSMMAGPPSGGPRYGLIVLAGMAMGAQSAAVVWLQVPAVSTTYITGTWTSVAGRIGTLLRASVWPGGTDAGAEHAGVRVLVLVAYSLAALGTGYVHRWCGDAAVVIPPVVLALVVGGLFARALIRKRGRA